MAGHIYIYPGFNAFYYSFYLKGILDNFGSRMVRFTCEHFPAQHLAGLSFVIERQAAKLKVYIDATDRANLNEAGLGWSDVYAKINVDPEAMSLARSAKIMPVGPSFAIRLWGLPATVRQALWNYQLCRLRVSNRREYFANY